MTAFKKTKDKILQRPTLKNIMPDDLKNFLNHYGFILEHVNGDHFIYSYPACKKNFMLNIPMNKPIKPCYIDKIRDTITEIEEENL